MRLREWISSRRALLVAFALTLPLVTPRIRGADEIEYFSYLPSIVFDRDLSFGNEYRHFYERDPAGLAGFKETFLDLREPVTGRHINFAPLGSALLWSPFYLGAHAGVVAARALGSDVPADGYSLPYAAAACYASALYAFAGLLLVHGVLRRHGGVPEPAATLSVLGLWFGTPVLYYMTIAPAFSHSCSLFAVALVVSLTLREDERRGDGVLPWALLGAGCGLAGLVREQDVLIGVLPGGLLASRLLRERRLSVALRQALALAAGAALVFLPQLLAYRALNGGFGPSRMVARKMSWSSPHFLEVLFDPGHGLFPWSPLLLFPHLTSATTLAGIDKWASEFFDRTDRDRLVLIDDADRLDGAVFERLAMLDDPRLVVIVAGRTRVLELPAHWTTPLRRSRTAILLRPLAGDAAMFGLYLRSTSTFPGFGRGLVVDDDAFTPVLLAAPADDVEAGAR